MADTLGRGLGRGYKQWEEWLGGLRSTPSPTQQLQLDIAAADLKKQRDWEKGLLPYLNLGSVFSDISSGYSDPILPEPSLPADIDTGMTLDPSFVDDGMTIDPDALPLDVDYGMSIDPNPQTLAVEPELIPDGPHNMSVGDPYKETIQTLGGGIGDKHKPNWDKILDDTSGLFGNIAQLIAARTPADLQRIQVLQQQEREFNERLKAKEEATELAQSQSDLDYARKVAAADLKYQRDLDKLRLQNKFKLEQAMLESQLEGGSGSLDADVISNPMKFNGAVLEAGLSPQKEMTLRESAATNASLEAQRNIAPLVPSQEVINGLQSKTTRQEAIPYMINQLKLPRDYAEKLFTVSGGDTKMLIQEITGRRDNAVGIIDAYAQSYLDRQGTMNASMHSIVKEAASVYRTGSPFTTTKQLIEL